jgi:hypothetical protein
MHNRALHDSLAAFVQEAAWQLAEEVSGGAEIPFELDATPTRSAPLYCYRPQTGRFIAQRATILSRLPTYPQAARLLGQLPDLPAYLAKRQRKAAAHEMPDIALQAFLAALWAEVTDFVFDEQRFAVAYQELEDTAYTGCALSVVITPVDGLVIESDEVPLGQGLSLVRAITLAEAPGTLPEDPHQTVAVLSLESKDGNALEAAGRRLKRLQSALRLWDDAEPALGPTAYAKTDGSAWMTIPLATGMRRPSDDCLLSAEEEDPLRAFCGLVARRTPRAGELAWALRRFELGCERGSAVEALTDWLLAARALFADDGYEHVAERLAAICAEPSDRPRLEHRVKEAISLERAAMCGFVRPSDEVDGLVEELGACLRAVLRDVLCGHLDPALRKVADGLVEQV